MNLHPNIPTTLCFPNELRRTRDQFIDATNSLLIHSHSYFYFYPLDCVFFYCVVSLFILEVIAWILICTGDGHPMPNDFPIIGVQFHRVILIHMYVPGETLEINWAYIYTSQCQEFSLTWMKNCYYWSRQKVGRGIIPNQSEIVKR